MAPHTFESRLRARPGLQYLKVTGASVAVAGAAVMGAWAAAGADGAAAPRALETFAAEVVPLEVPAPVPAVRPSHLLPPAEQPVAAQTVAAAPVAVKSVHVMIPAPPASAPPKPTRINATYVIKFDGVEIGTAHVQVSLGSQGYSVDGRAEIAAMFGAFTWRSESHAQGALSADGLSPAAYRINFSDNGTKGLIRLGYAGSAVTEFTRVPKPQDLAERVPLRDLHFKNVMDPLAAIASLTRGTANPCARRLAIFDGRERFDLIASLKREQVLSARDAGGQPGLAYVCRLRRVSIAGHRPEQVAADASPDRAVEVVLRAIPSANLFVPQAMTIGTQWGTATVQARRIEISSPGSGQIALSQ